MDSKQPLHAIHGKAIDAACDDDRIWFEQHPDRNFRVRHALPFEFNGPLDQPPEGITWRTLVARVQGGVRMRVPVGLPIEAVNEKADDRHLASMFQRLAPEATRKALKRAQRKSGKK